MSKHFIFVMKQTSGSTSVLLFVFFVSRMILLRKMSSPHKDIVFRNILLEGLALFFVEGIYCFFHSVVIIIKSHKCRVSEELNFFHFGFS